MLTTLSLVLGVIGVMLFFYSPALGCIMFIVPSWLLIRAAQRKRAHDIAERRHQETLAALRAGQPPPA